MKKVNFDKKTLKYGSASVILAVVFIALVLVLNLVVTAITDKYNLFVDLTQEELYTISESTENLLKDIGDDEIKFIFFTPLDEFDNESHAKSVKALALEFEEKYDNISIEYIDMLKNPGAVAKYRRDYNLSATTIVVESAKRFVAFDLSECFVYTQDTSTGGYIYYAFNGEYRFASSILRVTREEMPRALFTTNHLEAIPAYFENLLIDSGFEVQRIDLMQENIPDDTALVVINDPQTDFTGIESETDGQSEITKLSRYLEGGGNAMLFVDPDTPELKNLFELCNLWGIKLLPGMSVIDDVTHVSSLDSRAIIAKYVEYSASGSEEEKEKSEKLSIFHKSISSMANPQKAVSYYTMPLSLAPITDSSRGVGAILASDVTSYVPLSANENFYKGSVPLMAAGYKDIYNSELSENETSYFLVGGSTHFVSDTFLGTYQNLYANYELMGSILEALTDETLALDIKYKVYNDTSLALDNATTQDWLAVLVFVLPGIVLAIALLVFLRRRHL